MGGAILFLPLVLFRTHGRMSSRATAFHFMLPSTCIVLRVQDTHHPALSFLHKYQRLQLTEINRLQYRGSDGAPVSGAREPEEDRACGAEQLLAVRTSSRELWCIKRTVSVKYGGIRAKLK